MNGSLPLGWITDKLGNLVSFKTGKLNSNAATPNGKYPFFTCSQETFKTDTYSFDTECVLLGGNNANGIYPLKYYSGKFDAYQRTYVIRSINPNKLKIRYLYYALQLKLDLLRSISTGAATKFLTLTILTDIGLEVPPPHIQDKIAAILSAYDDLIENNTRRIEILEEMARSIYREWFVKFRFPGHEQVQMVDSELGLIPEGWEVKKLGEVIRFKNGKSIKVEEEGDYLVYGSNGIIGRTNEARYQNAIIIGRVGAYCGSLIYSKSAFNASDNTIIAESASEKISIQLAFYVLEEMNLRHYAGGAAQPLLTQTVIKEIPALVPDLKTNKKFQIIIANLIDFKSNLTNKIQNLRQTRDLLLPRLISGEIDVENLDINTSQIAA